MLGKYSFFSVVAILVLLLSVTACQCGKETCCPKSQEAKACDIEKAKKCSDCKCDKGKACDTTAFEKPGFKVEVVDGRLWVLLPGEEKTEKHITLIGAGPNRMSIKAKDRKTALMYLASKPGFKVDVDEDQRIWVFTADEAMEKSEKHITRIGVGPLKSTLKAKDRETLDAYMAAK